MKAILVDDCEVLQEGFTQETLQSVVQLPILTKFEHGAQIVCVANLIGFLRSKEQKIEDCKIVIAKQVDEGDYLIDYDDDAD